MLKNVSYNLLETITIVSKSLYRYDTYIHDAENSKSSRELWTTFKAQREKELSILLKELKNQIDSGMLGFGITCHLPKYTYAAQTIVPRYHQFTQICVICFTNQLFLAVIFCRYLSNKAGIIKSHQNFCGYHLFG
jgi:hypothetical protein